MLRRVRLATLVVCFTPGCCLFGRAHTHPPQRFHLLVRDEVDAPLAHAELLLVGEHAGSCVEEPLRRVLADGLRPTEAVERIGSTSLCARINQLDAIALGGDASWTGQERLEGVWFWAPHRGAVYVEASKLKAATRVSVPRAAGPLTLSVAPLANMRSGSLHVRRIGDASTSTTYWRQGLVAERPVQIVLQALPPGRYRIEVFVDWGGPGEREDTRELDLALDQPRAEALAAKPTGIGRVRLAFDPPPAFPVPRPLNIEVQCKDAAGRVHERTTYVPDANAIVIEDMPRGECSWREGRHQWHAVPTPVPDAKGELRSTLDGRVFSEMEIPERPLN